MIHLLMMLRYLLILLFFPTVVFGATMCPLPTEENVSYQSVLDLPIRSPDQIIPYGKADLQYGELWLPKTGQAQPFPLVALIHGGCWLSTYDIKHTHALSAALADAGYAVWSVEYRRTGDEGGGWPGTYEDVVQGLNFISKLSAAQVSLTELAVLGHSAGGHLALLASSDDRLRIRPKLILGMAPIVDIAEYAVGTNSCQMATLKFMGGMPENFSKTYRRANPINHKLHANLHSIHGSADVIVPLVQSTKHLSTTIVKGAGHFDFLHPHTHAFRTVLRELAKKL